MEEGPEDIAYLTYVKTIAENPPSCIRRFNLSAGQLPTESMAEEVQTAWRTVCRCGGEHGRVRGYLLSECSPEQQLDGPDAYLSPLTFECSLCAKATEIVDCNKHGYNPVNCLVPSSNCGFGGAAPRTIQCKCGASEFLVTVGFGYWDAAFDLYQDCLEDGEEIEPQENFGTFACHGKCAGCGTESQLTILCDC